MGGNGCSCHSVSPETSWPISSEAPAGMDDMSWSSVCVWDSVSFPPNVGQISAPVEIRNPNNAVRFSVVIVSQSSGSPQLSIRFTATNDLGGTWEVLGSSTNITTLGVQFIGAVTGITYRYIRAEMMSSSGTAMAGGARFWIWEA